MTEPATALDRETSRGRWHWWKIALLDVALLVAADRAI
jgi:hypothetical protein